MSANQKLHDDALEFALATGAIAPCEFHEEIMVGTEDEDAEEAAYAMADDQWKAGEYPGLTAQAVRDAMEFVLGSASTECPRCEENEDA